MQLHLVYLCYLTDEVLQIKCLLQPHLVYVGYQIGNNAKHKYYPKLPTLSRKIF